jgi:hypothetical protein
MHRKKYTTQKTIPSDWILSKPLSDFQKDSKISRERWNRVLSTPPHVFEDEMLSRDDNLKLDPSSGHDLRRLAAQDDGSCESEKTKKEIQRQIDDIIVPVPQTNTRHWTHLDLLEFKIPWKRIRYKKEDEDEEKEEEEEEECFMIPKDIVIEMDEYRNPVMHYIIRERPVENGSHIQKTSLITDYYKKSYQQQ